jgi:hypothetical protein
MRRSTLASFSSTRGVHVSGRSPFAAQTISASILPVKVYCDLERGSTGIAARAALPKRLESATESP